MESDGEFQSKKRPRREQKGSRESYRYNAEKSSTEINGDWREIKFIAKKQREEKMHTPIKTV